MELIPPKESKNGINFTYGIDSTAEIDSKYESVNLENELESNWNH